MLKGTRHKAGFTLVEMLAVISIMGILAGMGVVGFQTAVAHARTKDAALNVTAYLERTANEARRLNDSLCVRPDGAHKLVTYKSACNTSGGFGDPIDQLILEDQISVKTANTDAFGGYNIVNSTDAKASFAPRPGLSAAPFKGYVVVIYSGGSMYGAAVKTENKNSFTPQWDPSGSGSWSEL